MRLGVNLKYGERQFVTEFVFQQFVTAAAAQEFVKARDARTFNVHLHVGFGDADLAHGRVVGVLIRVGRIPAKPLQFFFFVNAPVRRAGHVVDGFEVKPHGDHIAHPHFGGMAADVAVLNAGCVAINKEVLWRHGINADFLGARFLCHL